MKKLISTFLILILSVSVTYGAEYEIKWKQVPDKTYITNAESEYLILSDGFIERIWDNNLNTYIDATFDTVLPISKNGELLFTQSKVYIYNNSEDNKKPVSSLRIIEDEETFEMYRKMYEEIGIEVNEAPLEIVTNGLYKKNKNISKADSFGFLSEEYKNNFYQYIKLSASYNSQTGKYALTDGDNLLTDYEFNSSSFLNPSSSDLITLEAEASSIVGNIFSGKWIIVDSIEEIVSNSTQPSSLIEKTKEGKYKYYNYNLNTVTETEFDEYCGNFNGSLSFKKNDEYYVFDTNGNLSYLGKEKIKAVFYGNYIKGENGHLGLYHENGNNIIPPLYNNIQPVCKNVYIAEDKMKNGVLYNQGNAIKTGYFYTTDNTLYPSEETFVFNVFPGYIRSEKDGYYCIYDTEGNEIYKSDKYRIDTNGFEIFLTDRENNRIGKVILKDTNPNVRINGKLLVSDTMPRIKNGRTLVPLRALAEETGFEVSYNEETKEINITNKDKIISFKIGEEKAYKNGEEIILEAPPEIVNNRTLVPLRAVSDAFGYDISWNAERRLAEITE